MPSSDPNLLRSGQSLHLDSTFGIVRSSSKAQDLLKLLVGNSVRLVFIIQKLLDGTGSSLLVRKSNEDSGWQAALHSIVYDMRTVRCADNENTIVLCSQCAVDLIEKLRLHSCRNAAIEVPTAGQKRIHLI